MTQTLEPQAVPDSRRSSSQAQSPRRHELPPVITLGGRANALSVARNLGRMGVSVYALNEPDAFLRRSRFVRYIDVKVDRKGEEAAAWERFLLSEDSDELRGAIVLSCSDEGIELIAKNREALSVRFLLDESNPQAQLAMLNKLQTYRLAREAGVPTAGFWVAQSPEQLESIRPELVFPLIVKPRLSHVFEARTGKKLVIAHRFEEVAAAVQVVADTGTDCVLMEMIPGPDSRLCSYFTYLDEDSRPLFHFTKRIIRRYPVLMGTACYHITDWIPEAAELGNRLFRHVGLRGLANVEFKLDVRDGKLKLIECNARFTASDCLVASSGVDLAAFVYNRIIGRSQQPIAGYVQGMRLWDPLRDFQAFLELRKMGELSLWQWLGGVVHRQTFPYFQWTDPMPALARLTLPLRKRLGMAD